MLKEQRPYRYTNPEQCNQENLDYLLFSDTYPKKNVQYPSVNREALHGVSSKVLSLLQQQHQIPDDNV